MTNIGISEGMGKKIVEALKNQAVGESGVDSDSTSTINMNMDVSNADVEFVASQESVDSGIDQEASNPFDEKIQNLSEMATSALNQNLANLNSADVEGMEMPTNVAVLKQLITQLPTGVTKQTGAQIIKQTMEALGISMKSVLQEAQQVQESLNNSARECQANILENKRQIALLEKQTQKYQKQYAVLNDIISLFIQTNNY